MNRQKNLLIVNSCMDPNHPSLSHQAEISFSLAPYFQNVYVLTGSNKINTSPPNFKIYNYGTRFPTVYAKIVKFVILFVYLLVRNKFDCVFSHMSARHSLLMGPFLKLKNKKHILWYAHTSKPLSLVFAYKFVDSLITSTQGSCPLSGSKVKFIGQSIDTNTFQFVEKERKDLRKFVHLGRFDRSKKIDLIISNFSKFLDFKKDLSLTIIGTPSKKTSMEYKDKLFEKYSSLIISRSLVFLPAVNRRSLPSVLSNYDLFLHAYQGSLDKVILEATLVGLPVITLNQEYLAIFGTWSKVQPKKVTLELEINSILKLSMSEIGIVLKKRHEIASTDHSLNQWITKVEGILNS